MSGSRARVLCTGAAGSLRGLAAAVEADGAQYTEWPLLSFSRPADMEPLETALRRLGTWAAICITSPRGAEAVTRLVEQHDLDVTLAPVVWTSPACEAQLRRIFPRVEVSPPDRDGAGLGVTLADAMLRHHVGSPVLFPCGSMHRAELVMALRAAGREVDVVEAYRTILAPPSRAQTVMAAADILVVTSPAQARLLAMVEHRERPALVAIGPTTANEARRLGWAPDAVAASPVVSAVAAAIHSLLPSYS